MNEANFVKFILDIPMKGLSTALGLRWVSGIVALVLPCLIQAQPHTIIKTKLTDLSLLAGNWAVETQMISTDGRVTKEQGEYIITWALDSTYLLWTAKLENSVTGRSRQFHCWLTYDTEKMKYRKIYLYARMSLLVIEFGDYDGINKILQTTTTISLPQGDESIRTVCKQIDQNHIEFESWAKFTDKEEFNDFIASMKRK